MPPKGVKGEGWEATNKSMGGGPFMEGGKSFSQRGGLGYAKVQSRCWNRGLSQG